MENNSDQNQ